MRIPTKSSLYVILNVIQCVLRILSDCKVVLIAWLDAWRSATIMSGALCAMISGITMMLPLSAGSLDSVQLVN